MASSLRLSAGSFTFNTRLSTVVAQSFAPISHQCRSFSQAPQRWAYRSQNFTPPSMAQPSMKSRTRNMLQGHLPNDIGLLPGTYVRPLWRDMPSIFGNPRDRWQMEYTWLKSALQNFMSLAVYCTKDMKAPWLLRERRKIARQLHRDMYSALASGNIPELRRLCCDGLAKKLVAQVEKRAPNEKVTWKLVQWLRQPSTFFSGIRVLSDRATKIPELPNSGIRQIVLRMTSRQSMSKSNPTLSRGTEVAVAPVKEQDCHEYVVIQQIIWNGKDSGWRVWGHAKPTDVNTVYSDPYFAPGLTALERMEAIKNTGKK